MAFTKKKSIFCVCLIVIVIFIFPTSSPGLDETAVEKVETSSGKDSHFLAEIKEGWKPVGKRLRNGYKKEMAGDLNGAMKISTLYHYRKL